jgi:NAD(P)-dependent dehydrogenase (short-subunit alcohol dehydrogenase family)
MSCGGVTSAARVRVHARHIRSYPIVTGASQGIGAALVNAYRNRGYRVVATSRSIVQGDDIGDPDTAERVVKEAKSRCTRGLPSAAGSFLAPGTTTLASAA